MVLRLFDHVGDGLFTVDAAGRVVGWSRAAAVLTGRERAQVVGRPFAGLGGRGERTAAALQDWLHAGAEPDRCSFVFHASTGGGATAHIAVEAVVLRDRRSEVLGAVGTLRGLVAAAERSAGAGAAAALSEQVFGLVGSSQPMREVFRRVQLAARSDVTTLITGESGTGKELAAQAVHALSRRADCPFLAVNCGALPEALLESELFGHERGAFTGAVRERAGLLERADRGTLFLDEVGEMSPLLQVKLLRALQERRLVRVGGDREIPFDVRLVTATHRRLDRMVAEGRMREDFYYRIRVYEIGMPPLRERLDDVPRLCEHFRRELNERQGRALRGFTPAALDLLLRHDWPGNVRELRNAIEHAYVCAQGDWIEVGDLPPDLGSTGAAGPVAGSPRAGEPSDLSPRDQDERQRILATLAQHRWSRQETAQALGFSRVTLWKKMRRYGIDEGVFRRG